MSSLAFVRPQLEDAFALQLAEEIRPTATVMYSTAVVLSAAAIVRCCAAMAAASLNPRLAVLAAVAFLSLAAHGRALNIVARPSKVERYCFTAPFACMPVRQCRVGIHSTSALATLGG